MISLLALAVFHAFACSVSEPELLRLHRDADQSLSSGDLAQARASFEEALLHAPESPSLLYGLACVEARSGDSKSALSHLERAIDAGWYDEAVARWDEDLVALRSHSEFEKALARMRAGASNRAPVRRLDFSLLHEDSDRVDEPAVDPAGEFVVAAARSGMLRVFRTADASLVQAFPGGLGQVWKLALSPDGTRLAGFGIHGTLKLWSLPSGKFLSKTVAVPEFARERVPAFPHGLFLEFDPTSRTLLLVPRDRGAWLVDREGELRVQIKEPLGSWRNAPIAWAIAGTSFFALDDKDVVERDATTGEELRRLHAEEELASLAISPEGDRLLTGNWSLQVELWDLAQEVSRPFFDITRLEDSWRLGDDDDGVCDVRWSPNGDWIGCSTSEAAMVFVLGAESGGLHWRSRFLGGRIGSPPVELYFAPSGERLWYGCDGGVASDVPLTEPAEERHDIPIRGGFAESPSGLGARAEGNGVSVLDLATGDTRWQRLDLESGGHVILVPAGWIDGEGLDARLIASRWLAGRTEALYPLMERFDPKRVRAGLAGVPLLEL